jgi:dienelactone hydrolase
MLAAILTIAGRHAIAQAQEGPAIDHGKRIFMADRGIAVLRYDKRTKVHDGKMGNNKNLTVREETIDDALLVVKLLRSRFDIDPKSIFIVGHSLGGMLAPRIGHSRVSSFSPVPRGLFRRLPASSWSTSRRSRRTPGSNPKRATKADLQGWRDALSDRQDVTIKSYPALNHLFIAGEGKSTPSEYERPGHVADSVVEDIAGWIGNVGAAAR